MSAHEPAAALAKRIKVEEMGNDEAKWVKLKKITYRDPQGRERVWEMATRPTRPKTATIDGVDIIAILHRPGTTHGPEILLQKQYRPPTDKIMIEVPAGLIDVGETPEQCALRELREETGYVGAVQATGPTGYTGTSTSAAGGGGRVPLYSNAGMSDACLNYLNVSIDMSLPENQSPQPQLEDGEFIETFTVPLRDMHAELRKLDQLGYGICARVDAIAEGVELAKQFGLGVSQ